MKAITNIKQVSTVEASELVIFSSICMYYVNINCGYHSLSLNKFGMTLFEVRSPPSSIGGRKNTLKIEFLCIFLFFCFSFCVLGSINDAYSFTYIIYFYLKTSKFLKFYSLLLLLLLVVVCVFRYSREGQRTTLWICFSPSFTWVLWVELKPSGFPSKHLSQLSHLASLGFLMVEPV